MKQLFYFFIIVNNTFYFRLLSDTQGHLTKKEKTSKQLFENRKSVNRIFTKVKYVFKAQKKNQQFKHVCLELCVMI